MNSAFYLKDRRSTLPTSQSYSNQIGFAFIIFSVLFHILFFGAMLFMQSFHIIKPMPSVIQVDLVSFAQEPVFEDLSEEEPAPSKPEEKVVSAKDIKTKKVKVKKKKLSVKKPDISLKTKPKNLDELLKPKKKTKKVEKKPLKEKKPKQEEKAGNEEETHDDAGTEQINEALSRLEKMVKEQSRDKDAKEGMDKAVGTGSGKKGYKPIDLYHMVLATEINEHWVFNDRLARMSKNLEARILIKILKNGEIRDIFFETRSGNAYLDDSAEKAIKKASPLPELPKGYSTYDIGLKFSPTGLK